MYFDQLCVEGAKVVQLLPHRVGPARPETVLGFSLLWEQKSEVSNCF